ncbi:MAG: BlaI/MecI/CopY family transcriptional regulator [Trueperaceae bacterium]|nr:MAG: BlaI/MecI/CopY family transcriptional regulator [Trueperaceae bacterium]
MRKPSLTRLSRRERQLMNIIYQLGQATVKEVLEQLADPPSYSAVRATLRLLEEKGFLRHLQDGARYVYLPTVTRDKARKTALNTLLQTFFNGSAEQAVATLISDSGLSEAELDRLSDLIAEAKREGR